MKAPLLGQGHINIGLRNDCFDFKVQNPSRSIETGIFKLFGSDVYVDMNHIARRPVHEIIAIACAAQWWSRESWSLGSVGCLLLMWSSKRTMRNQPNSRDALWPDTPALCTELLNIRILTVINPTVDLLGHQALTV
jgi:hypothetical protein